MGVISQEITDRYAVYNGDCIEVMTLSAGSVHLSISLAAVAGCTTSWLSGATCQLPRLRRVLCALTSSWCERCTG